MRTRFAATVAFIGLLAVACGTDIESSVSGDDPNAEPVTVDQIASTPREDVPSALDNPLDESFPKPLVDPIEVRSGGPPPDGIPAIDEPKFLKAEDVTFLEDNEPVLALQVGDEARAYPIQIMTWHEIVNDTVAGVPVTVTYCPLCNSSIAYDRRLGDRILDFGTSGMLFNSALVMYDRQTETLWSHFTAEGIIGHLTGKKLDTIPVATVSWEDFREAHSDALVLSRDTGHSRDYGRNPYPGYDNVDSSPFLFEGEVDGRLAAKERVIGIENNGEAVAVRRDVLVKRGLFEIEVGGEPLVLFADKGTASALDASSVAGGRDVGAVGVFRPSVEGRELSFELSGDQFADSETGTRWDILGRAVEGPFRGSQLEPVNHVDTFWFAWGAFQPETAIVPKPKG